MPNDLTIIAKNINVRYTVNNQDYFNTYTISAFEDQDMMTDLMLIVSSYRINDWGVELSNTFVADKKDIYNKAEIIKDLVTNLDKLLAGDKTLNLTK